MVNLFRKAFLNVGTRMGEDGVYGGTRTRQGPPDFLFGAATAAYQIERGLYHTNWKLWEDLGTRPMDGRPTVKNHDEAGVACDSWNRFDEDLAALQKLGANMYRFSVDWSRVEPKPGEFDDTALDQYAT